MDVPSVSPSLRLYEHSRSTCICERRKSPIDGQVRDMEKLAADLYTSDQRSTTADRTQDARSFRLTNKNRIKVVAITHSQIADCHAATPGSVLFTTEPQL